MSDSTQRFSSRVENYVKYRPTYPPEILDLLARECGLSAGSQVADVGSGTGILAEMLLQMGCCVYGVEPNREMREAGESLLSRYTNFHSIDATAEATTLPSHNVDFVTAGQAFHWFDVPRARAEFARILKPGGCVVLVWNTRQLDTTPFLKDYEQLLEQYGTDYAQTRHHDLDKLELEQFFASGEVKLASFSNSQQFDLEGLKGRLISSSYTPEQGHPNYGPILAALQGIFNRHQQNGRVAFLYTTMVYYGHIGQ